MHDIKKSLQIYNLANSNIGTTFYTLYFYFQGCRKSYTILKSKKVLTLDNFSVMNIVYWKAGS